MSDNMKLFDFISLFSSRPLAETPRTAWTLNTSNSGKLQEFERLFNRHGIALAAGKRDLPEIAADPVLVAVHKAAQVEEGVLVEDTSLEVEDAEVGIQVRSLLDRLEDYAGNKAVWRTLLAYRQGDLVYVYEGRVDGTIVHPRGEEGFGFDPVFLPDGAELTLAQSKPDAFNARAKAVEALMQNNPHAKMPPLAEWEGPWQ